MFDSGEKKASAYIWRTKQNTADLKQNVSDGHKQKIVDRGKLNTVLLNGKEKTRLTLKLKDFINGVYVLKLKTAQTAHGGGKTEYEIEQDFRLWTSSKRATGSMTESEPRVIPRGGMT